jgi:hypothetical protein
MASETGQKGKSEGLSVRYVGGPWNSKLRSWRELGVAVDLALGYFGLI